MKIQERRYGKVQDHTSGIENHDRRDPLELHLHVLLLRQLVTDEQLQGPVTVDLKGGDELKP
jgi:hypothetical protein